MFIVAVNKPLQVFRTLAHFTLTCLEVHRVEVERLFEMQ